jgi:pimeloyl-ACP methyl ester carboxylesterase
MPSFKRGAVEIYYESYGAGYPILLIAPGGMRSAIALWRNAPWDPVVDLAWYYRVVVMDQRNAGQSRAPILASDGWQDYLDDQLALLDYLDIDRFHVGGMCIGGSFSMGLIQAAPARVTAALLFQTIGLADNRQAFYDMYDSWANELRAERPEVTEVAWQALKHRMYDGEFLFTVDRDFVRRCPTPLLVLCGNDLYHPREISLEVAQLAPRAQLIEDWKTPAAHAAAKAAVAAFLAEHTPR